MAGGAVHTRRELHEIRLVGRGGQGIVTAGELLGQAALLEGAWAQSIPSFGPERRGALASCTLRLSATEILLKCSTATPDVLLVFDPTIWRHAPVFAGLVEDAVLVFNSPRAPEEIAGDLDAGRQGPRFAVAGRRLYTVDATAIAIEILGRPITNTALMGAFAGATGLLAMGSVEQVLEEHFADSAARNVEAARAGAARLRGMGD